MADVIMDVVPAAIQSVGSVSRYDIGLSRKSGLKAPTMALTGPEAAVYTCEFSPEGRSIATGCGDNNIFLYNVYGDCENYGVLKGHISPVLELHWSTDGTHILSASADHTIAYWDVKTGSRVKKLKGHSEIVNSCHINKTGVPMAASGSDDGTARIFDLRVRRGIKTFEHQYQILAVSFDNATMRLLAGTLDNNILVYDLRQDDTPITTLSGHTDSITGISVSNDGNYLLSNSMDQCINIWDIRPYCPTENRCIANVYGATHNFEKSLQRVRWDKTNDEMFAAGSSDRYAYIWEAKGGISINTSITLAYKLPGHAGTVHEVCFHPSEPIVASCSADRKVYMGELDG